MTRSTSAFCTIVPPHLLEQLARHADPEVHRPAQYTLEVDAGHRTRRHVLTTRPASAAAEGVAPQATAADHPERTVYDAHHEQSLPGDKVRGEGAQASGDQAVNHAYDGLGATFDLYLKAYGRHSIDGKGLPLNASVHYGKGYNNAFWNGEQMVFGDGDGRIFHDFTGSVDVIGHELTHGVTQHSANLVYLGQSGALNESISDVFGSVIKQYALRQTVDQADWLIGANLLAPGVHGQALRSMKAPGTAYDDPKLGKDPQPATMAGYVHTWQDNGGVHINSGIPNHAFYLAATAIGGHSWEKAGLIWYLALTGGKLTPIADFAAFARLTATVAKEKFGDGAEHRAVVDAWTKVGVRITGASAAVPQQSGPALDEPSPHG
ncbi:MULTISPECIES: M4 family metallopeptidase [Streptomycetaceae]|uniref:Neutral metalloproteinase n=1 Tax=Streptantibioticus cattleyicolor (strain ATCC 35852 / DSM 46488 / JCM 4925 / NBRC 14057 / NRRL 8057) TaxID=1003195 RepID=F8JP11_STREN|nr:MULTISPECIES: M4 family metallopeptidase [Streptomycetaceae]AEW93953.1 metalloprotease [Streptantibioticus cattleyicolor NRRL 8057 = DSM 46488]MYS58628.1 peptidase M4 family protein [Streptomyces sp. SID5468]CCB74298.1 Extracellular metalloprotease [Streptantibioticus cattleyicolor NRRL 8057 = DSM 46488]